MVLNYSKYWLRILLSALLIVGGLNWGFHAAGYNLVTMLARVLRAPLLEKVIYILVAISAVVLAFDVNTWLPFLGESVLPSVLVPLKEHGGNTQVVVDVSPNAKVVYWSANPGNNPETEVNAAYGDLKNSGVVQADSEGKAVLVFDKGTAYVVPTGKHISSHVHYRELSDIMMGPVQSVFI